MFGRTRRSISSRFLVLQNTRMRARDAGDERNCGSVEVSPLVWPQCLYCVFGATIVRWVVLAYVFSFNLAANC